MNTAMKLSAIAPIRPVVPRLIDRFEIHVLSTDLTPSDLRAIRKVGGNYGDVRGYASTRILMVPAQATEVFVRVMKKAAAGIASTHRVIILRGAIEQFGGMHVTPTAGLTVEGLDLRASATALKTGAPCSCCGLLLPPRGADHGYCSGCAKERARYESAVLAANVSGARYELAERCARAALGGIPSRSTVWAVFEELSRAGADR